ncbi:MAG: sulfatase-like hydrolase/transferase [Coprobacillaceae bacterium]
MKKRPNIVLFLADQMRQDSLHHMGNEASVTPNLDAILEEGVSFENAYCQNPVCVPSRCSFLTGLYPHTTGHRTMHFLQRENEPNILKEMKQNGYEVIWIGRNDVVPSTRKKTDYCDEYYDGIHHGNTRDILNPSFMSYEKNKKLEITDEMISNGSLYSFYIGKLENKEGYGKTDWTCVQIALDYIERKSKEPNSKPFFLYCTLSFPHPPYACEDPWYSSINRSLLPPRRPSVHTLNNRASMLYAIEKKQNLRNWNEEQFSELRATYLAMVSRFDYQFGLLKKQLKKYNMYDDTSVFVYSDHGDYTGDYNIAEKVQNCFENPISNIPLLIKPAKQFDVSPRKSKALIELLDIPSTIAEMAGFSLSYTQFGKSLVSTIAGNEIHKDAVFCEGGRIHGEEQAMEKGHTPTSPYYPRLHAQSSEGPEHTKAVMCRINNLKYTLRLYETDELYDLDKDPLELENQIHNPNYAQEILMFKERILKFYMSTTDFVPSTRDKR